MSNIASDVRYIQNLVSRKEAPNACANHRQTTFLILFSLDSRFSHQFKPETEISAFFNFCHKSINSPFFFCEKQRTRNKSHFSKLQKCTQTKTFPKKTIKLNFDSPIHMKHSLNLLQTKKFLRLRMLLASSKNCCQQLLDKAC